MERFTPEYFKLKERFFARGLLKWFLGQVDNPDYTPAHFWWTLYQKIYTSEQAQSCLERSRQCLRGYYPRDEESYTRAATPAPNALIENELTAYPDRLNGGGEAHYMIYYFDGTVDSEYSHDY